MVDVKDNAWGQITVERDVGFPPLLDAARDLSWKTTDVYRWRPRIELANKVPNGFGVSLQCLTDANDNRVFLPIGLKEKGHDDYLAFFTAAWNAGFSILCQTGRMDESYRFSFRLMWFLFQRVRKMQQFVRRGFKTKKDLLVAFSIRNEVGEDHVLPWDVEATTTGPKCPVAVEQLIEAGNRAALEFGIQYPTTADQIHFGLAAAARREPSHPMSPEQAAKVIRYSLFDVEPDPADLTNEIRQVIEQAVLETIEPFVMNEDMPYQVFDNWFWGKRNTFLKQVVATAARSNHQVDDELARRTLLDMGWRAYQHVGQCINAAMYDFRKAVPNELNDAETFTFDQLFLQQPAFGDLPLIMLAERLDFAKSVVWDVISSPDNQQAIGALHTLLQFYMVMCDKRRYADRLRKRKTSTSVNFYSFDEDWDSPEETNDLLAIDAADSIDHVFSHIRSMRDLECGCDRPNWRHEIVKIEKSQLSVSISCDQCGRSWPSEQIAMDELRRLIKLGGTPDTNGRTP